MAQPSKDNLPAVLDADYMFKALAPLVERRFGKTFKMSDLAVKHQKEHLIRYVAKLRNGHDPGAELRMIGKQYATPHRMRRSFKIMEYLYAAGAWDALREDRIAMPEPIGMLPELRVLLMQEAPGRRLRDLVQNHSGTAGQMRLLAQALAKLHAIPLGVRPVEKVRHKVLRLKPRPRKLARLYPDLIEPIAYILNALREVNKSFAVENYCLIHGDFHLGQVHVESDKIWILDLEHVQAGDPAYDVGRAVVSMKGLRGSREYLRDLIAAFVREYGRSNPASAYRIPFYEALINLKRACKLVRNSDASRVEEQVKVHVTEAAACLKAMAERAEN